MSIRTVLIVLLAVVFGLCAVVGVNALRGGSAVAAAEEEKMTVVVAAADIPRFTAVTADMVKTRDYPKSFAPAGAATRVEDVIDRVTDSQVVQDEPVLEARLAPRDAGRGVAAVIPPGMRALTILTPNLASGVAGLILPGNKVDVLFTKKANGLNDQTGGGTSTTLLQDVEIMAVDQRVDPAGATRSDPKELRSVTLVVSPDQATKLDLAQNLGTLHLSLRNYKDRAVARTSVATGAELRFFQGKPWDERLKDVLDVAAKLIPDRKVFTPADKKEPEKPAAVKAPEPPQPLPKIRTVRGTHPGEVEIR
ncbi:MAG TPA: Flp pilus assembly protein CpaB [Gemmataceae bacterium]|nr:Flp pilus assembly protein CpaB [Gemmataceae bacterium]